MSKIKNEERMLNLGEVCDTKTLGKITFKELSLEEVIKLGNELLSIYASFGNEIKDVDSKKVILTLLGKEELRNALYDIASAMSNKKPEDFKNLPISDWLKIIITIKNVLNWEELKELFFQIIPKQLILQNPEEKESEKKN